MPKNIKNWNIQHWNRYLHATLFIHILYHLKHDFKPIQWSSTCARYGTSNSTSNQMAPRHTKHTTFCFRKIWRTRQLLSDINHLFFFHTQHTCCCKLLRLFLTDSDKFNIFPMLNNFHCMYDVSQDQLHNFNTLERLQSASPILIKNHETEAQRLHKVFIFASNRFCYEHKFLNLSTGLTLKMKCRIMRTQ